MKTLVVGLPPYLDRDAHLAGPHAVFRDDHAFVREGILRSFTPNLSTIAVTTCLVEQGYSADYVDLALQFGLPFTDDTRRTWVRRLEHYFRTHRYDAVFLSCVSSAEHRNLGLVTSVIKSLCPGTLTGAGSFHANSMREKLLDQFPDLDFVFLGDLEGSVDELMAGLGTGRVDPLAGMDNVITRNDAPGVHKKPQARPSESRFSYRICDRYLGLYDSMASIGMKGCPYTCSFCQEKVVRPGFRKRSPAEVVQEAVENYEAYEDACGHRMVGYGFMEPIFGLDQRWTDEFATALEAVGTPFEWGAQTRVGQLDDATLARLGRNGCRVLYYGLENYSAAQLRNMDKTDDPDAYLESFEGDIAGCTAAGIKVETNILFGYPGESESTLAQNIEGIRRTQRKYPHTSVNLNLFRPLPDTRGLQDSDFGTEGRLLIPDWWEQGIVPGVTVIVQPSPQVPAGRLLDFYGSVYDPACYERRGISSDLLGFLERGELAGSDIPHVARLIRKQVWRVSRKAV